MAVAHLGKRRQRHIAIEEPPAHAPNLGSAKFGGQGLQIIGRENRIAAALEKDIRAPPEEHGGKSIIGAQVLFRRIGRRQFGDGGWHEQLIGGFFFQHLARREIDQKEADIAGGKAELGDELGRRGIGLR